MSDMKIENYSGSPETFTFPYNPNSLEIVTSKFIDQRKLPYSFTFMGFTKAIKSPISLVLNGHFSNSTKNSNYRSLVKKVNSPDLKKIYFANDYSKFYIGTGISIQKVPTGERPLHVDYVANYFSPFGILFSDTQKSGNATAADKNEGDMETPFEKITGTVTFEREVTIKDSSGNGFIFTPTASGTMTFYLVKVTTDDNVVYITEYLYVDVDGAVQVVKNATTSGDLMLTLTPDESINDLGLTVTNVTSPLFYFRDGWASD